MKHEYSAAPILRAATETCRRLFRSPGSCAVLVHESPEKAITLERNGALCEKLADYSAFRTSPLYPAYRDAATTVREDAEGSGHLLTAPLRGARSVIGVLAVRLAPETAPRDPVYTARLEAVALQCATSLEKLREHRLPEEGDATLESLFTNAPEAVVLMDENNRVLRCNPEFTRLFGYTAAEATGRHIDSLLASQEQHAEASSFSQRAEQGETFSAETIRVRKDGSPVEVSLLGAPIVTEGRIVGIFGIYRDISARKKVERELSRSEARYRHIFERAPIGIFQTHSRGYFLKLNRATATIFGYASTEDFLNHVRDLASDLYVHPGRRGEFLQRIRAQREVKNFVMDAKRKDGTQVTISINARISAEEKNDFVIDGFILDLTELKKTEYSLSRSLREKEVLLQELHHRVKNNMQIISSLLRMEADTFTDDHDAAGRILRISQNRIRSMSLIHEKLYNSGDLTRVDLGEYSRDLCNEVFELSLTHPLPETDFDTESVETNIDFAIPFGLILNELLLNALKHAFRGIEEPRLSVRLHPEGDQLILSVCDNGAGLPEDFELQRSGKLGLQLIDSLVAQLSGSIRFRSDGGTCCTLRFPNPAAEPLGISPSL